MRTPLHLATFLISLLALSLSGATFLQDDFGYTNGSLITVSNGKWQHHSPTDGIGELQVISGRLFLSTSDSEDVNADLNQRLLTDSEAIVYAQFTVNFTNAPSFSSAYFAHFRGGLNGTTHYCRIFSYRDGDGLIRVGVANHGDFPTATSPQILALNSNYTVLVRYVVSNATSTLWVNPYSDFSSSVTATDIFSPIVITNFAFRQTTGIGKLFVDNLIVADSPPFAISAFSVTNGIMALQWQSILGGNYVIQHSSNLLDWTPYTTSLTATGATLSFTTNVSDPIEFFRIYRSQ